jgi:peptide/nickel transport system permease protein
MRFLANSWKSSGKFRFGVITLAILILIAVIAPLIYRPIIGPTTSPARPGMFRTWEPASAKNPLGTDGHGRDILTDFLAGLQATLLIGFLAGTMATAVGIVVGFVSGYKGGFTDTALITGANMLLVIPSYPILVGLTMVTPNKTLFSMAFILALFSWPFAARTIRAQVLSMKQQPYVDLAKVTNQKDLAIIFTEIMPNLTPYLLMSFAFSTVGAMVGEVGLAVIGLGPSDVVSLGMMINFAQGWSSFSRGLPGLLLVPIGVLILIFVAITMINRGLEEYLNPRLQNVTGK